MKSNLPRAEANPAAGYIYVEIVDPVDQITFSPSGEQ